MRLSSAAINRWRRSSSDALARSAEMSTLPFSQWMLTSIMLTSTARVCRRYSAVFWRARFTVRLSMLACGMMTSSDCATLADWPDDPGAAGVKGRY
jgi:hypothetical protein